MSEVASAFVTLVPSAKGFGKGISSQIGGDVAGVGKTAGRRLGGGMAMGIAGLGTKLFAPLAAVAGAMAVGGFIKDSIAEARESQKVGALTAQVIKTTGKAAHVTAGQVGDLATAISNKTGIDDEAIQSASNLLLTFTNVRNEVGKGNDVFNQATQIATDMGAALGGDPKSSAIQLGKALNDPVKGITALTRVGVSFTAGQKKQVQAMVKSGNTLGAQKLILGELNKEFGGAAAASATAGEKFSTTFGNFKEAIGTALLPILDKTMGFLTGLVGGLTTKVGPAFAKVGGVISKVGDAFKFLFSDGADGAQSFAEIVDNIFGNSGNLVAPLRIVGQTIKDIINGFRALFLAFQDGDVTSDGLVGNFEQIGAFARALIPQIRAFITGTLIPLLQQAATFITTRVVPAVMGIITAFRGYLTTVIPIVQAFVAGMMARIGPMMPQIRAIFSTIGQIIVGAMGLIQAVIQRVTAIIGFIWSNWGSNIMNFVAKVFGAIVQIIGGVMNVIAGIIKVVTSLIKGDWAGAWAGIKQIVAGAWQAIKGIISGALAIVQGVISGAWALIKRGVGAAWSGISSAVSTGIGNVVTLVKGLPAKVWEALGNFGDMLHDAGAQLIQGLINGIGSKIQAVKDKVGEVAGAIKDFFPGSPVKEGPLRSWNNGGAGKRLGGMLADGLAASRAQVAAASSGLASSVADPTAAGLAGAGMGGGRMHPHDIAAIVDGFARSHPIATMSAGSADKALGGMLR